MSIALENARLFDETGRLLKGTEQRAAELAIINSVQAGLVAKMDMQAIYDLVGDKVRDIFDAQSVLIGIFDHATRTRNFPYNWEKGERYQGAINSPFNKLTEDLIASQQPIVIHEFSEQVGAEFELTIAPGTAPMKSGVFVPLVAGDRVFGLITLQNVDREHAFSDADVRLLQTLANSMSVALENARLFDETQRLLKETEQRNTELAIINSVQQGLASQLDMQAIYDLVGDKIVEVTGSEIVVIDSWDADSEIRRFIYSREKGERYPVSEHPFTPLERSAFPDLQAGKTIVWNEGMEERIKSFVHSQIVVGGIPLSVVIVPLKSGKTERNFVTTISLQNTAREYAFSESDVRLVETLANSMSIALENARLFDETQRRAAELATINTVSTALAGELDLKVLIDLIGDQIRTVFSADLVFVALLN